MNPALHRLFVLLGEAKKKKRNPRALDPALAKLARDSERVFGSTPEKVPKAPEGPEDDAFDTASVDLPPSEREARHKRYRTYGKGSWLPHDSDARTRSAYVTSARLQAAEDRANGIRPPWMKRSAFVFDTRHLRLRGEDGDGRFVDSGVSPLVLARMIELAVKHPRFRSEYEKGLKRGWAEFYIRSVSLDLAFAVVLDPHNVPPRFPSDITSALIVTTIHRDRVPGQPYLRARPDQIEILVERRGSAVFAVE